MSSLIPCDLRFGKKHLTIGELLNELHLRCFQPDDLNCALPVPLLSREKIQESFWAKKKEALQCLGLVTNESFTV